MEIRLYKMKSGETVIARLSRTGPHLDIDYVRDPFTVDAWWELQPWIPGLCGAAYQGDFPIPHSHFVVSYPEGAIDDALVEQYKVEIGVPLE